MTGGKAIQGVVTRLPFEPVLGGALVGGLFALIEAARAVSGSSTVPVATQLLTLAVGWYLYALTGLLLAAFFEGTMSLIIRLGGASGDGAGRVWAGWFSLSCFILVVVWAATTASLSSAAGILAGVAAAAVMILLSVVGPRVPRLRSVRFWGSLNVVLLLGVSLWSTLAGPFGHGVHPAGFLAILPALGIAAVPLFMSNSRRRRVAAILISLTAVSLALICFVIPAVWPSGRTSAAGRTNVLLITVDTLRSDHLGCYGNEWIQTPRIDELAERGVLFENTVSPMPLTNPSHTTILTGLHPASHGVVLNRYMQMREGLATLPEILSGSGYRTAAFVSGSTLRRSVCALRDQFQLYDDNFSALRLLPDGCLCYGVSRLLWGVAESAGITASVNLNNRRASVALREAQRWLRTNADEPFFLWVHFFDPHGAYDPPRPYDLMYDASYTGDTDGNWYELSEESKLKMTENARELRHFSARYAGEVSYADLHVGRLIEVLERQGVLERTLVVFTSDHGESLTEHGYYFDHGAYLYEQSLSVPLIFRLPDGRGGGSRRTELVTLADIQPTVLECLGMEAHTDTDGRSLADLCLSSGGANEVGSRLVYSALHRGGIRGETPLLSVRTPEYKYICTSSHFDDLRLLPQSEELYDLSADPGETLNLAPEELELLRSFRTSADSYWDAWLTSDRVQPAPLSDESREALRSLGYMQ